MDWEEFLTYMMLLYRENDYLRTKKDIPFQVEAVIRHIVHNRVGSLAVLPPCSRCCQCFVLYWFTAM